MIKRPEGSTLGVHRSDYARLRGVASPRLGCDAGLDHLGIALQVNREAIAAGVAHFVIGRATSCEGSLAINSLMTRCPPKYHFEDIRLY